MYAGIYLAYSPLTYLGSFGHKVGNVATDDSTAQQLQNQEEADSILNFCSKIH